MHDPTDLEYDEATGRYGPRERPPTAIDCKRCGFELTHEELIADESGFLLCKACKIEQREDEEDALADIEELDKLLSEV